MKATKPRPRREIAAEIKRRLRNQPAQSDRMIAHYMTAAGMRVSHVTVGKYRRNSDFYASHLLRHCRDGIPNWQGSPVSEQKKTDGLDWDAEFSSAQVVHPTPGETEQLPLLTDAASNIPKNGNSRSPTITTAALVDLTGYARSSLYGFAARAVLPVPDNDRWPTAATIFKLIKYLRESRDADGYRAARTLRTQAQADRERQKADWEQGQFYRRGAVHALMKTIAEKQKGILRQRLEKQLGQEFPELLPQLTAAVDDICRIFRDESKLWTETAPNEETPKAIPPRPVTAENKPDSGRIAAPAEPARI